MAEPFNCHRDAARALLTFRTLTEKEGQFCGGLSYRHAPLSEKQEHWLQVLLERHRLPHIDAGGHDD